VFILLLYTKKHCPNLSPIYVPCVQSDSDDDHSCEYDTPPTPPHFKKNELLGRYEAISILPGTFSIPFPGPADYAALSHIPYQGAVIQKRGKLESGMKVTIKKVRRIFHTECDTKRLLTELTVLRALNHDNIVRLYDIIPPNEPKKFSSLTIISEFVEGNLHEMFQTNQFLTTLHVQYILYQILLGVKYMHSANIAHCNLKPVNILINEDCAIKISEFGSAKAVNVDDAELDAVKESKSAESGEEKEDKEEKRKLSGKEARKKKRKALLKRQIKERRTKREKERGSAVIRLKSEYRAPEIILSQSKPSTLEAGDVWSIGCIFAELLKMQRENRPDPTKRGPIFPLDIKNDMDLASRVDEMQGIFEIIGSPDTAQINKIRDEHVRRCLYNLPQRKKKNMKRMYPGADRNALDLLVNLLKFDVDKRITIDGALEHPYLKSVREFAYWKTTKPVTLDFQSGKLQNGLRELVLKEVVRFNKYDEKRLMI